MNTFIQIGNFLVKQDEEYNRKQKEIYDTNHQKRSLDFPYRVWVRNGNTQIPGMCNYHSEYSEVLPSWYSNQLVMKKPYSCITQNCYWRDSLENEGVVSLLIICYVMSMYSNVLAHMCERYVKMLNLIEAS